LFHCWGYVGGTEAVNQIVLISPFIDGVISPVGATFARVQATSLSSVPVLTAGKVFLSANQLLTFRVDSNITGAAFSSSNSLTIINCARTVDMPLVKQSVTYDTVVKAEGIAGVTTIETGTYTPVASTLVNIPSVSGLTGFYTRIGKTVTVTIAYNHSTTAQAGIITSFRVNLPIARTGDFSSTAQCIGGGGAARGATVTANFAFVIGSVDATQSCLISTNANSSATLSYGGSFTYQIE